MISDNIDFILASQSPRRAQLLKEIGIHFRQWITECNEEYPIQLDGTEIPLFLSQTKAKACNAPLKENSLIIAADTIVWNGQEALGKPHNQEEAQQMLKSLSGRTHQVITGTTLRSLHHCHSFVCTTQVTFTTLSDEDINYYIEHYHPFDKAGSYGIQEWIGMTGIKRIDGCFYNVMGLPLPALYQEIKKWTW